MRILIADDERLIVEDLIHEVRELYPSPDVVIDGTSSALDAARMAEEEEYDVALLDIDMPDMDGINLARHLISSCPAVNIIFVTGYEAYALEAHEVYCSAFLVKPVSKRKLKKAFENLRHPFFGVSPEFLEKHFSGEAVIGKKIEICREKRNLSRQELADLMKVSRQTVFRWEQGERMPDILTFLQLARLLGVRMEELLGLSDTCLDPSGSGSGQGR